MRAPLRDEPALLVTLKAIHEAIRAEVVAACTRSSADELSVVAGKQAGDVIYAVDRLSEQLLVDRFAALAETWPCLLVAEGLGVSGRRMLPAGTSERHAEIIALVDPIDGTRGLMFDKRSAWCLMGVAPDHGPSTTLADISIAVMTELPPTRQSTSDVLWAVQGQGARGERQNLVNGTAQPIPIVPSGSDSLQHSFATVNAFFQGGKELTARLEEAILARAFGPWNPLKAEIYSDQYICSGGQLAEVALGRDRFVLDVRPLVHRKLGVPSSLCCRPYDLCTLLIAQQAGCVVADPFGEPIRAPLDTTTNVAFAVYANRRLAERMIPIVREEVQRHLG